MRSRLISVGVVATSAVVACVYSPGATRTTDANQIDVRVIDANFICVDAPSTSCSPDGTTLLTCSVVGMMAVPTTCTWGCLQTGAAHCGKLVPSGSAAGSGVLPSDVSGSGVMDIMMGSSSVITINGMDGGISSGVRTTGTGVRNGIEFQIRGSIAMFRFNSLHITGPIKLTGSHPIALVADQNITIDDQIDARGTCGDNAGQSPGPGGFAGANKNNSAGGSGGGSGATTNQFGGGGGGHAGKGGNGSHGPLGGAAFDPTFAILIGGGGGGGGGGNGGAGGGGGGAIQLVSNATIAIGSNGVINAGGCGGLGGNGGNNDGGGGGGAGGAILLEALMVQIYGVLAGNGGGGGEQSAPSENGSAGRPDSTPAIGINNAGNGGAGTTIDGVSAGTDNGGGGGAVGYIRVNTKSGSATITGTLSPSLATTAATQGSAAVQ
ncbi:MAG: hypothetical protein JWO36_4117 [Myxococcales bacterium]|nr:hypothetical protein [Myxococcales bacterium]